MKEGKTIWKRNVKDLWTDIPIQAVEWCAIGCTCVFILSPVIVGVVCLFNSSIEYTVMTQARIVKHFVWPVALFLGIASIMLECREYKRVGRRFVTVLRQNPVFLCFLFLALWILFSTTINGWNVDILFGMGQRFESIFMQLGYFLVLFPAAVLIGQERSKILLIRLQEIASLFLVPIAFIFWETHEGTSSIQWSKSVTAVFSNINYYGYYLAVSIPLAAAMLVAEKKTNWKILSVVVLAANTVTLAFNGTMGAWVACGFAMAFLLITHGILEHKINGLALIAALVFAVCLFLPGYLRGNFAQNFSALSTDIINIAGGAEEADHAGSGRWIIWKRGIELLRDSPVFGIGFEGVEVRGLYQIARNNRVHNEYLQYALFYGIPAGVAYFAGSFGVYLRGLKRKAHLTPATLVCLTGAFGYHVSAFFGLTLFCTTPFLFLFLGMGYVREDTPPSP